MSQSGFDVLLKMIQETNTSVKELTKLTAENGIAIKVLGVIAMAIVGGLITFYFKSLGGN